jgi:hypothetical protein
MTAHDRRTPELDLLRSLPLEVSLDRVQQWVDQFPPPLPPKPWYAKLKTNFNIMMTISSLLVGGAIYLMSTLPTTTVPTVQPTVAAPAPVNMPMALPEAPTPSEDAAPAIAERVNPATSDTMLPELSTTVPSARTVLPTERSQSAAPATPLQPAVQAVQKAPRIAPSNERRFDLSGFTNVKLMGLVDVELRQGPFSVVAVGEPKELDRLVLTVKDNTLRIKHKTKVGVFMTLPGTVNAKLVVHLPRLDEFEQAGSGNSAIGRFEGPDGDLVFIQQGSGTMHIEALQQVKDLRLELLGSGDLVCKEAVVSGKTDLRLAGSGALKINGRTELVDLVLMGSGSLDAAGFEARTGNLHLIGSGDAVVNTTGELDMDVQGSGKVKQVGRR